MMKKARSTGESLALGLGWFSLALGMTEVFASEPLTQALGMEKQNKLVRFYGAREIIAGIGIFAQSNPLPWIVARIGGDALDLTTLGLACTPRNPQRKNVVIALGAVAAVTALDIICARTLSREAAETRN